MGYDTKVSSNAREQLEQFLGVFYTRFSKPRLKFLRQMLYGIQITKSVILNRIAAEIDENVKQVKIEMRLCRHLAFKDLWRHIHEAVMEHAKKFVRKTTLIIIDPSDVQKPYAKKMQYLAKVWDGSKGRVGDNLGASSRATSRVGASRRRYASRSSRIRSRTCALSRSHVTGTSHIPRST